MKEQERYVMEQILRTLSLPREDAGGKPEEPGSEMLRSFLRFMDEVPGGFLIYYARQDEQIIYANQSLVRMLGCETVEELREYTGNSFRGIVHPDELETVEESIWEQLNASQHDLDYVEYRACCKDGSIRWLEDYGHYVEIQGVGGIFYVFLGDATGKRERMRMERDHLDQEYLRQMEVIEGLSVNYEAICYLDLDKDQIVPYRLSSRTAALFEGEHIARAYIPYARDYVTMWVHPEDRELVAEATAPDYIREKLANSQTYYLNYRVIVKGELQYIQLRVVNVGHQEGVSQVVLGYRRVDEEIQRQMEQQSLLAEALAKASLAVTSKNTFLSNISHDMRTPLNAIFGFTSLAKLNLGSPEEAKGYLDRVEAASRQLLDMIDKVLEMSALSDSSGLDEGECGLREIVQEIYEFLRPQAQEKNIVFRVDCEELRNNIVFADEEKLRQLILYLVNNAVTYTNPGGRVTITAKEREELPNDYAVYRLEVQDTGIGISPEFVKKAFEPFSREKNSTLSGVHGIGLGLTIAKNIVDLMGGHISVESKVGEGSTFTVTMTLRHLPKLAARPEFNAGPEVQRILLVEDNEINREIEMELLARLGFAIDPAENGKLALDKIQEAAPGDYDLILMDLQMPVMDGWETARAIRGLANPAWSSIPIIALSANVLQSDQRRSKESGINAHLLKPMDLAVLLDTIERLTGKRPPEDRKPG